MTDERSRAIYLVVTGAPLTRRAVGFVAEAEARGWQPAIIATQAARAWLDEDALSELDMPVLTEQRSPRPGQTPSAGRGRRPGAGDVQHDQQGRCRHR